MRADSDRLMLSAAVNVGAQALTDLEFPDAITRLLRRHEVEHRRLEITETAAMKDPNTTTDIPAGRV